MIRHDIKNKQIKYTKTEYKIMQKVKSQNANHEVAYVWKISGLKLRLWYCTIILILVNPRSDIVHKERNWLA